MRGPHHQNNSSNNINIIFHHRHRHHHFFLFCFSNTIILVSRRDPALWVRVKYELWTMRTADNPFLITNTSSSRQKLSFRRKIIRIVFVLGSAVLLRCFTARGPIAWFVASKNKIFFGSPTSSHHNTNNSNNNIYNLWTQEDTTWLQIEDMDFRKTLHAAILMIAISLFISWWILIN